MLKLHFLIDKHHLAFHLCSYHFRKKNPGRDWSVLKKGLIKKFGDHPVFCLFLPGEAHVGLSFVGSGGIFQNIVKEPSILNSIFCEIFQSRAFIEAYKNTLVYKQEISTLWEMNQQKVASYLENITAISGGDMKIYLLHPDLQIGSYLGHNVIEWGYARLDRNYQIYGLAHEILHSLTEQEFLSASEDDKWLLHSLIYLAADEELRVQLKSGGGYFTAKHISGYNKKLVTTAQRIFPFWHEWLEVRQSEGSTIIDLYCHLKNNPHRAHVGHRANAVSEASPEIRRGLPRQPIDRLQHQRTLYRQI